MSVEVHERRVFVVKPDRWHDTYGVQLGHENFAETTTKREALAVARILRKALREARKVGKQ